ncbi:MAG: hypothetical protein IT559_04380 [Alphaproteobacteria bacterium]|nr:hypothetical protein [Alphaproteobacteria bacterium]
MSKKKIFSGALVAIVLVIASGMTPLFAYGSWNYRLTVEVETPEGVKTGSAVRQVSNSASIIKILDLPDVGNPANVKGEAVVVDLGERGVLFALIDDRSYHELYSAFPTKRGASTVWGILHYNYLYLWPWRKAPVSGRYIPKMVMFEDMNDPKSVKLVSANELGEGMRLKSVTATLTMMPVTWGVVDGYLPWLKKLKGGYLHGGFTSKGAPYGLHGGNFKRD